MQKKDNKHNTTLQNNPRIEYLTLVITVSAAIFITIALASYNKTDAGFSQSLAHNLPVNNLEGKIGAWLADFLFYFTGITAFILPLLMFVAVSNKYYYKNNGANIFSYIGYALIIVAVDGILAMHFSSFSYLPAGIGGILGESLAWKMAELFNIVGASFILFSVILCGIVLINPDIDFGNISQPVFTYISLAKKYINDMIKKIINFRFISKNSKPTVTTYEPNASLSHAVAEANASCEEIIPVKLVKVPKTIEKALANPIKQDNIRMISTKSHYSRVELPNVHLLDDVVKTQKYEIAKSVIVSLSKDVEHKFQDFGIKLDVVAVYPGPVVTRFELKLAPGTKVSTISNLGKDLARTLSVTSVRIVDVIPGKSVIGLEIPNTKRQIVRLKDLISASSYANAVSPVTIVLGKDISGHPVVVDLAKMPHLLVAGTTGSGKSVGLNAMLLSFLYKSSCENLRMILIDPKMLELSVYDDIPHLLTPVITDMREAAGALTWCVAEMERRYKLMSLLGVRNLAGYNDKVTKAIKEGTPILDPLFSADDDNPAPELSQLPSLVVVADEYADMIMVLGKKVEQLIARLAQKARAAGIHLVLATQRPSVNVVTGLIKANIPTRIAFQVSSRIDSRTVLDQQGAEQLLGHGDMLYLPPGTGVPIRVHGAYVSDEEVHRVVKYIKDNNPAPEYVTNIIESHDHFEEDDDGSSSGSSNSGEQDPLYDKAVAIVISTKKVSISSIQRKLKIGYNRSANIVEAMEKSGLVSAPSQANGTREVLASEN